MRLQRVTGEFPTEDDPPKRNAARGMGGAREKTANGSDKPCYNVTRGGQQALTVIASIPKSPCSQFRIAISEWRGARKLELREMTSLIPGIFYPVGAPLVLDLEKLPLLLDALERVRRSL